MHVYGKMAVLCPLYMRAEPRGGYLRMVTMPAEMNSDPRHRADGERAFAPSLKLAEVAWRSGLRLWRTSHLSLIVFALWGITFGPNLSFPQAVGRNPLEVDGIQAARAVLRDSSVSATPIQMSVDWVVVPMTVTDEYGYIQTDLQKDNFEVYDEKVRQNILSFAIEDTPVAVGIIFDTSKSMADKIQNSREAALQFFKTSNPEDLFMLVAFSSRPYWISAVTGDYEKLLAEALSVQSDGKTALLDAIHEGLVKLRPVKASRKALLVISDGGDNHSRYTFYSIRNLVKESNVQIYTIGIFEPPGYRDYTPEEFAGPAMLAELAHISGGRPFSAGLPDEIPGIAEEISRLLRSQYVIGYRPSNLVRDGSWRQIRVKLRLPGKSPHLQIAARSGYYAPTH